MFPTNILLVEDETITRKLVGNMLLELGHQVEAAGSGEEGLERFAQGLFPVVVSDVNLPGINGIEMIRRLKTSDPTLVPIVMTSRSDQETAVHALECGVRSFLVKPFSKEELGARVRGALRERKEVVETRLLIGDLVRVRSDLQHKVVEQGRYLDHLIDAAPFGILSTDMNGRILTFNHMAEQMYGYSYDEIAGQSISVLSTKERSEDTQEDLNDHCPGVKVFHIQENGDPFPVLMHRRDILNDRGQVIAHLYVVEDLSERECLESQLLYAERLSLLGQMAPRIAHEFKTPLQVISGHSQLALNWLETGNIEQACS